jgi:hypothetical protein
MDDDDFIIGAKKKNEKKYKSRLILSYDKNDINQCINGFKKILAQQEIDKQNLTKLSMLGEIGNQHLRPIAWQILLNLLPADEKLDEWVGRKQKQRNEFRNKVKGLTQLKKFSGDPLGGTSDVIKY